LKILITGGAGFIGSHVCKYFVEQGHDVIVADRFTYAGKARNLAPVLKDVRLLIGDLATGDLAERCAAVQPDWVVHMAAETHVDHAITHPERFVQSNMVGTTRLLQALWRQHLAPAEGDTACLGTLPQKIIVYSTDEVFGPTPHGHRFTEHAALRPSNAYSASKVGVEGIANAFYVTHALPIVIVRPCNTYGPGQHPEKAIPRFVGQCLRGEPMTLYNDGQGSRDWLYVTDHAAAIEFLLRLGVPGEAYNLAAGEEHTDTDIALRIAAILGVDHDAATRRHGDAETGNDLSLAASPCPRVPVSPVRYVPGRPGHDRRYAMDGSKLRALGWEPRRRFDEAFAETVRWNADHQDWWSHDLVEVA